MNTVSKSKRTILSLALGLGLAVGAYTSANTAQAATKDTPKTYTVKKGDCFWSIAKKYKMSVRHLCAINGKTEHSIIYPKDKLKLKGKEKPVTYVSNHAGGQVVAQPQQQAPVAQEQPATTNTADNAVGSQTYYNYASDGSEASAKEWIAQRESGGSYTAVNGRYQGRYQLDASYLNGDYSPANQERVVNQYVKSRYGSFTNAKAFWQAHGWY